MEEKPLCPKCGAKMRKDGKVWSGTHKRQRWQCNQCGKTKIPNEEVIES